MKYLLKVLILISTTVVLFVIGVISLGILTEYGLRGPEGEYLIDINSLGCLKQPPKLTDFSFITTNTKLRNEK